MRAIIAVPRTLLTLLSGLLSTGFIAIAVIAYSRVRPDGHFIESLIKAWARSWLVPAGCELTISGTENVDPTHSYVVVANHVSNFDVMVCFQALPIPIRYLAKKELFAIPLLRTAMKAIGIVEVDRQAKGAAIDSVNFQSSQVIARGHSLIIYPEGTRSRNGELRTFKKGAFTMAVAAGMPILPVTIKGTWEMWQPGAMTIRPGRVDVMIDTPIPTEGLGRGDIDRLRSETHALIESRLREMALR